MASVELSGVNHKQFDLRIVSASLPAAVEAELSERIHKRIARGSITCRVRFDSAAGAGDSAAIVDERLAAVYVEKLRRLSRKLKLESHLSIAEVAGLPGVCRSASPGELFAGARPLLFKSLDVALSALITMRVAEGEALRADLEQRLTILHELTGRIEARALHVPKMQSKALLDRIRNLGADVKSDDPRLIREVALLADRCDISEEITRLRSHLKQVRGKLKSSAPVGRTLDFVVQEMNREINTIGSKANDRQIAAAVISFKAELERAREQVQNVE